MYELPAKCLVSNLAGAGVRTISPVNSVNYSALGRPYGEGSRGLSSCFEGLDEDSVSRAAAQLSNKVEQNAHNRT